MYGRSGSPLVPTAVTARFLLTASEHFVQRVRAGEELGPVVHDATVPSEAKNGMGAIAWRTAGVAWREPFEPA